MREDTMLKLFLNCGVLDGTKSWIAGYKHHHFPLWTHG